MDTVQSNTEAVECKPHPLKLVIRMIWVAIGMIATFHFSVALFTKNYKIVIDGAEAGFRCIPQYSVYLLKYGVEKIERGKIYTFKAKNMGPFYKDGMLITKYAAGLEGDEVVQNEQGVFINGANISQGYPSKDKLKVSEHTFYKTYTLNQGEYYFTAPAERSFDSRYWGAAKESQILGEAIPLW